MAEPDIPRLREQFEKVMSNYVNVNIPKIRELIDQLVTIAALYASEYATLYPAAVRLDASKVGRIQIAGDADQVIMPRAGLTLTLAPELVDAVVGIIDAFYEASTVEHPYVGTAPSTQEGKT